MRWMYLPSTPSFSLRIQEILGGVGAPCAAFGLESFGNPRVFRLMKVATGGMKFGRTVVRSFGLSSTFKRWARTPEVVSVVMGLRVGFLSLCCTDERFSGRQTPPEVSWCLGTLFSTGGYSSYRPVFGSSPGELFGRVDRNEDLRSAKDTSLSGQFT